MGNLLKIERPLSRSGAETEGRPRARPRLTTVAELVVGGVVMGIAVFGALPAGAAPASPAAATSPTPTSALSSTSPSTGGRVTFGVEPASANGPDGRSSFSLGATPGAVVEDDVAVVNYSTVSLSLQLYATDAINISGGGLGLPPPSSRPTGVGSWISLPSGSGTVEVAPESAGQPGFTVVPVLVRVPAKASPGDHVGAVVASPQSAGKGRSGQRIVLDQRVATRMYIQVAGPLHPQLTLTDLDTTYGGVLDPFGAGRVKIDYLVTNAGNVNLAVDQSVTSSQLIGSTRQITVPKIPLLLPGASVHESVVVPGVWPQFLVHESVTAQARELGHAGAAAPIVVTAGSETWAIPWPLIVIVLVVLVLLLIVVRRRRRRRRAGGVDGGGETGGEASGEMLAPDDAGELEAAASAGEA
jgi:hypothetical protein